MPDKDWAEAVILIVYSDRHGVMGLLLNRPTEFPLSHLFPELRSAPPGKDPLYFGGLVASGARAVLRAPGKREGAQRLFGDVAVLFDSAAVEKAARSGLRGDVFRVYAGYAGWSPEQLRHELLQGNWRVLPDAAAPAFDAHPETLWRRLSARR
jgi:putative transcriptional regulator